MSVIQKYFETENLYTIRIIMSKIPEAKKHAKAPFMQFDRHSDGGTCQES
jgi:hypothetical protein